MSSFRFPDGRDAAYPKAVIGSQQYMQMTPTRDLYPAGFFNERKRGRDGGPTETLAEKAPRANNMRDGINRNLIHTQLAARVNVTRYILPLKLPNVFASPGSIEVKKTFVSGDAMFALRYTSAMFTQGIATDITRKPPPLHMTGVNLPTLNYILVNYQLYVWDHMFPFADNANNENYRKSKQDWKSYFSSLYTGLLERNNFMDRNLEELQFELMLCDNDMLAKNVLMQVHVWKFIRNFVRVAGVFIGSEEQGGQNQGVANPASHNPIDFMGAMQLSGKYENVRNLWTTSGQDVSNGDTLGFTLVCIDPTAPATLCMQLSGNAVTHKQMTFDFSLFNGVEARQPGARIWMLAPAVQNRLKHAIGLADASVTSEAEMLRMHAHAGVVDAYALGSNLKGEFFMQFGIVNQMSRGVAGSMRAIDYAKDATACTVPTNSEVLLRFTIGDPSVERECTGDEVVEFVRERTCANIDEDDYELYMELVPATLSHKHAKKHSHGHRPEYANHLTHTTFDFKHLKRWIGDKQFFKNYAEKYAKKYKEAAVIVSLIQAVQLGAKKAVEKQEQPREAEPVRQQSEPSRVSSIKDGMHGSEPDPLITASLIAPKVQRRQQKSQPSHHKPATLGEESKADQKGAEDASGMEVGAK